MLDPNVCYFDFLAFAEAICALACVKDNFSKCFNPNLNNLNGVSEELWEIVPTLLKGDFNKKCFPVNNAKFLRTAFHIEPFHWLLVNVLEKGCLLMGFIFISST